MNDQKLLTAKPESPSRSESIRVAELHQEAALQKIEQMRRSWEQLIYWLVVRAPHDRQGRGDGDGSVS